MNKQEALSILNITEDEFFDKNKIKVFDGIAGCAKSTASAVLLDGTDYGRYTSTNKLKRDAFNRFGGNTFTIAGGLFYNKGGEFMTEFKDAPFDNLLIDEVLQAGRRVLDYALSVVGKKNVIICTDSKQMLPPGCGLSLINTFNEFCNEERVIVKKITKSLRPVNDESTKLYNACYSKADEQNASLFKRYKKLFSTASIDDVDYNINNAYICHTNDIEKILYKKWGLSARYDIDLLTKGGIASKDIEDIDITRYSILPQSEAVRMKTISYLQPSNVGSVTRYQGSEVTSDNKLYYFLSEDSVVYNREFYTLITRAKDINNIVLVYVKDPADAFTTIFDRPVMKPEKLVITEDTPVSADGTSMKEIRIASELFGEKPLKENELQDFYIKNVIEQKRIEDGKFYTSLATDKGVVKVYDPYENEKKEEKSVKRTSMASLMKKTPGAYFEEMEKFYKSFEKVQRNNINEIKKACEYADTFEGFFDYIRTPSNMDDRLLKMKAESYTAGLDMYSAYPCAFHFGKVCDGRTFYSFEELPEDEFWEQQDKMVGFFMNCSCFGKVGSIITDSLVKTFKDNYKDFKALYIGACPVLENPSFAEWLYKKAYKSKEDKKELKEQIHYGWLQKKFLERIFIDNKTGERFYGINENNRYELVMCCVQSDMINFTTKCKLAIYGDVRFGTSRIDCIYFDEGLWNDEAREKIESFRGGYDFRIFKNEKDGKTADKPVIYKTYKDLVSRTARASEQKRNRRAARKAEIEARVNSRG